jgi:phage shock protein PspC (stress-responsive transcriptional regulator)
MEKVVTVNLAGNPYTFDESGFQALRAYLDRAEFALRDNPDKAEILRDLEQAIADKSAAYLSAHKTVVSAQEIQTILSEMGPVEGAEETQEEQQTSSDARPKKRLYRIRDGALISGVCSGLGAYFDIDRNLVRVLFVIATFMSSGVAIPVYIVMMFIIPSAHTSEEWAAAHGVPFNAQEVIDRAKREAAKLADDPPWRRRRRWRERHWPPYWTPYWTAAPPPPAATPPAGPASYLMRVLAGLFVVIFSLIGAALTIAFIVALISLASTGAVIGWTPPSSVPIWLAIIVLTIVYAALAAPFAALRHVSHSALTGVPYHHDHGGVFTLLLFMLVIWLVYQNVPEAHAWMDQLWAHFRLWVQQTFPTLRIEKPS